MKIAALVQREDTLQRSACSGDNWHTTWSNDDRQFVALCDGRGWQSLLGSPGKPYLCALYDVDPEEAMWESVRKFEKRLKRKKQEGRRKKGKSEIARSPDGSGLRA